MVLGNIKKYAAELKEQFKERIAVIGDAPRLAIIQVGNLEASNRYIKNKIKDCEEVGIFTKHLHLNGDITTAEAKTAIAETLTQLPGAFMMIQLPIPEQINLNALISMIPRWGDVDGMRPLSPFKPCTPLGIMRYLDYCNFDLSGKDVTIIGRSDIVGKPLAKMMTDADATVTLCHSKTKNLSTHIYTADLIVSAVGKANFLNCYAIHEPVIDVGINFNEEGKLVGDCFNTENKDVTPVPGGVGLLTRCALLDNIVNAAKHKGERL
jgi:methylenetetrahydrofolate dehydrogenase (NADP+)/methenyltetrahydrofolate cyclohydrolase